MRKLTFLLLAISLAPGGCAWLDSFRSDLPGQIAAWEASGEYGRALATLRYVEPTHPRYAQLRKQKKRIERLARELTVKTIRQANALITKGEWARADALYRDVLVRLPEDSKLLAARQEFLNRRTSYLMHIEAKRLLSRGEQLLRDAAGCRDPPRDPRRQARQRRRGGTGECVTCYRACPAPAR